MSRASYKVMVTLSCRLPVNITDLEYTFQNRKTQSTVRRQRTEGEKETVEDRSALFIQIRACILLLFNQ